jgi:hypothetical protein
MVHPPDFPCEPIKILDNCSFNELSFGVDTEIPKNLQDKRLTQEAENAYKCTI